MPPLKLDERLGLVLGGAAAFASRTVAASAGLEAHKGSAQKIEGGTSDEQIDQKVLHL